MNTTLLRSLGNPEHALLAHYEAQKRPSSQIMGLHVGPQEVYLAVQVGGLTRAFVAPLAQVDVQGHDLLLMPPVREEDNPKPCQVTAEFLRHLSPAPLFLTGEAATWRARAEQFVARAARSKAGDVLLGTYADARGSVSYNEAAKTAFEKDARRYLKRVATTLGWPPMPGRKLVSYNPGGIAVSGEAMLRAAIDADTTLFVQVDAGGLGGPFHRASPSGVTVMWRFEGTDTRARSQFWYPNQWSRWDTPARDLALTIQSAAQFAGLPLPELSAA